jgi:hypothetical protein
MRADALHDLIRNTGDDSPPEHKAIFTLWATLVDIAHDWPGTPQARMARAGVERAVRHMDPATTPSSDSGDMQP